jgi:hypothetical protein
MGAQAVLYSDEKLRLLAAFIYRMRTLPPDILKEIQPKPEPPAQKRSPRNENLLAALAAIVIFTAERSRISAAGIRGCKR